MGLRAKGRAPRLIVLENVAGLITSHGGKDFDAICGALAACDYRVGAMVIDAALFVPQSRERVFIIGVGSEADILAELVADGPTTPFHPPTLVVACKRQRDPIWWRLPVPPKRNTSADIIEDEPKGVRWHTQAETDRLLGMMTPVHLAKIETAKRAGRRIVGGLYRRIRVEADGTKVQRAEVRFDDVAGCLRVPTGGCSRQTIVIVEGDAVKSRLLSPREAARSDGIVRRLPAASQLQRSLPLDRRRRRSARGQILGGAHTRACSAGVNRHLHKEGHHVIIRCHVCEADPAARWKSPPAIIFHDRYREDGSKRKDDSGQDVFVYACRDHLSAKREEEIQKCETDRSWKKGELR